VKIKPKVDIYKDLERIDLLRWSSYFIAKERKSVSLHTNPF